MRTFSSLLAGRSASLTISLLLDAAKPQFPLCAHLSHPFIHSIPQFGMILFLPDWFIAPKQFQQVPALYLASGQETTFAPFHS